MNQISEIEPSTCREGAQSWAHRMADLYEEQQRRDKVILEGREVALKLRHSVASGGLTNTIKLP